jgi:hypothetical protein
LKLVRGFHKSFYGILTGIILILVAFDIIVLAKAYLDMNTTTAINLYVLGAIFILYGLSLTDEKDRLFYAFWGLFIILIGGSLTALILTADWTITIAVFIAGLGGLIAYVSLKS